MPLMLWLSPAFPVGSFAYSHGLEWAVEAGDVHDARSLGGWLVDLFEPRRAARRRDPVRRGLSRGRGRRLDCARRRQRARRRARRFRRAAPRNDRARGGLRGRGARALGLRSSAQARAPRTASPIRSRSPPLRRAIALRSNRAFRLSSLRSPPTPSQPSSGSGRSVRPTGRRSWPRFCRDCAGSRATRRDRRWPISAAPRSAPTSPPCATKRNIRGSSGRDQNSCRQRHRRGPIGGAASRRPRSARRAPSLGRVGRTAQSCLADARATPQVFSCRRWNKLRAAGVTLLNGAFRRSRRDR